MTAIKALQDEEIKKLKATRKFLNQQIKEITDERRELLREQRPMRIKVYEITRLLNSYKAINR